MTTRKKTTNNKPTGGRPSKITDKEVTDKIILALQVGAYIETAAALAGITKKTIYNWKDRGTLIFDRIYDEATGVVDESKLTEEEKPYIRFLHAIKKAMAEYEVDALVKIGKCPERWQALAWKLERKHHERWGRKLHGTIAARVGDGVYEDTKAKTTETEPEDSTALNPRNPGAIHITLAIGDKEVNIEDID